MLKINSTVFLELIFRQFLGHGIREIILLCGFKHSKIFKDFKTKLLRNKDKMHQRD